MLGDDSDDGFEGSKPEELHEMSDSDSEAET